MADVAKGLQVLLATKIHARNDFVPVAFVSADLFNMIDFEHA